MPLIEQVIETCLYVTDITLAEKFYSGLFELDAYSKDEARHVFFKLAGGMLLLFNPDETEKTDDLPQHGMRGAGHVAFAIAHADLEMWRSRLRQNGIAIEKEVTWPTGGRSIYFRDPFDNSLELVTPDTWSY